MTKDDDSKKPVENYDIKLLDCQTTSLNKYAEDIYKHYTVPLKNQVFTISSVPTQYPTYSDVMKSYQTWDQTPWVRADPQVGKYDTKVQVVMDDGVIETISREDLIKYISEQRVVRENEVARKMYDRYQVAVKLVRSNDDGDQGVGGST